jgi:predicted RNase H-like HicB family nuclease
MKDHYFFPAIFQVAMDGISVEFPDLPGCIPCVDYKEKAMNNAKDIIRIAKESMVLHLFSMEENNLNIPEPTKIADLKIVPNQFVVIIEAWMPPFRDKMRQERYNVSACGN